MTYKNFEEYLEIESELTLETDVKVEPVVYKENSIQEDLYEIAKMQRAEFIEEQQFSQRG